MIDDVRFTLVERIRNGESEYSSIIVLNSKLSREHIIMAAEFDHLDPFSEYKIHITESISVDKYFQYNGSTSDIIYTEEQCEEIYKSTIIGEMNDGENTESVRRNPENLGKISAS